MQRKFILLTSQDLDMLETELESGLGILFVKLEHSLEMTSILRTSAQSYVERLKKGELVTVQIVDDAERPGI
jgi:hypothetical protein